MNTPLIFKTRRELDDWRHENTLVEDLGIAWIYRSGRKSCILYKNSEAYFRGADVPEKDEGVYRLWCVVRKRVTGWEVVFPAEEK